MNIKLPLLLVFLCLAVSLSAQEKGDVYYSGHKEEILGDAESLFKKGDYDRALQLCELHGELLGIDHPEAKEVEKLKEIILECQDLALDMESYLEKGKENLARHVAEELRKLNPTDERLKRFVFDPVPEPVSQNIPEKAPETVPEKAPETPVAQEQKEEPVVETRLNDIYQIDDPYPFHRDNKPYDNTPAKRIVYKKPLFAGGVTGGILGLGGSSQYLSLGGDASFINALGAFGADIRLYGTKFPNPSRGFFIGADLIPNVMLGDMFLLGIGPSFFMCIDTSLPNSSATFGMSGSLMAGALLGGHYLLELGGSFYPDVKLWNGGELKTIFMMDKSIALWITLGYAF